MLVFLFEITRVYGGPAMILKLIQAILVLVIPYGVHLYSLHDTTNITVGILWTDSNTSETLTSIIKSINYEWMKFNKSFFVSDIHIPTHDEFKTYVQACRLWSKVQTSSFITNLSCREKTKHLALIEHLGLPHVSVSQELCLHESQDVVNYNAHYEHPIKVIEEIVNHLHWKRLIVLYDEVFDRNEWLDEFISVCAEWNVSISLKNMDTGELLDGFLSSFQPLTNSKYPYVLFTSWNTTLQILEHAQMEYLRTRDYTWLIYGLNVDYELLVPHLGAEDNMAVLSVEKDKTPYGILAISTLSNAYQTVTENGNLNHIFRINEKCEAIMNISVRNTMMSQIRKETNGLKVCPHCSQFTVRSSVSFKNDKPRLVPVAEYQRKDGLIMSDFIFPNKFNGFNNKTFHVTTLTYSFFEKKIKQADGSIKWSGLTFDILDELARDLNFSYVVTEPPDGQWGIEEYDGNWTGMIRQVQKAEVDFAAAPFTMNSKRERVIDFAAPYFYDQSVVIVKRPADDTKIFLYAYPFRTEVWICLGLSVSLSAVCLYLYTMCTPVYDMQEKWSRLKSLRRTIFDRQWSIWTMFAALMQQGNPWMPMAQSGRMMVGAFWFLSVAVVATYTGNLIAFLAVNMIRMPFDTLQSMIKQTSVKYGPASGVALVMLFRDATFDPYKTVADNMQLAPSYETAFEWVKSGNYAFIAEKSWFNYKLDDDCDIAMAKEEFYPNNYAWVFQSGAPYLKLFSERINKIRETGLLDKWIQKWTPLNLQCQNLAPVTKAKIAGLKDFQGGFYVLLVGIVSGVFALMSECILCRSEMNDKNDYLHDEHQEDEHYNPPDVSSVSDEKDEIQQPTHTPHQLAEDLDDTCQRVDDSIFK